MSKPARSLAGKVVVITGAARGIGKSTAEQLAAKGAVIAIGDLDGELAAEVAAGLGTKSFGARLDVTDRPAFTAFLDDVEQRLGPIDVLINNAGIMPTGPIEEEDDASTTRQIQINLHAVIHGTREAVTRMKPRRTGHIVNISSAAGKVAGARVATYAATKFGVAGFTEAVKIELQGTGVEISSVFPAITNTALADGLGNLRGMPRMEPDDIAREIVRGLEHPKLEIPAPRSLGLLLGFNQALPWRVRLGLARVLKTDSVISQIDHQKRAEYEERVNQRMAANDAADERDGAGVA